MGARGPKPMPANVHLLRGNPSKKPVNELLGEFRPEVEIPSCPRVLWPEAKKVWRTLTKELARYGVVSKLDREALAFGCQEWARWCWAEAKIQELNDADPKGEAGLIEVSPSGYHMQSVYLQISTKAQEKFFKVADRFGLNAAARARVTPGSMQGELFGEAGAGAWNNL